MRFFKALILFFLISTILVGQTQAQDLFLNQRNNNPFEFDMNADSLVLNERKSWLAASEVLKINFLVWGFDRYVLNADFARISFNTVRDNFKKGFVWDNDYFVTNLFSHPYHGALYFNSARTNGHSFWQSTPYVLGGSLMWELFMENEYPSINDVAATTIGGITLGEMNYRFSDLILDNRDTGFSRVMRELVAGIISPIRLVNRLINREAFRYRPYSGKVFSSVPVRFYMDLGCRLLSEQNKFDESALGLNLSLRLDYGDPFEDDFYAPFDWFRMRASFGLISSQPIISQINVIGALWGKQIYSNKNRNLMVGIFQHFDFYNSELSPKMKIERVPYRISEAAAIGGGLLFHTPGLLNEEVKIQEEFYLTGIILGASNSDYYKVYNRDYNLGSGYSLKFINEMNYGSWNFRFGVEFYSLYTWKGYEEDFDIASLTYNKEFNYQGDRSIARFLIYTTSLRYNLENSKYVFAQNRIFNRSTNYYYRDKKEYMTYDFEVGFGLRI